MLCGFKICSGRGGSASWALTVLNTLKYLITQAIWRLLFHRKATPPGLQHRLTSDKSTLTSIGEQATRASRTVQPGGEATRDFQEFNELVARLDQEVAAHDEVEGILHDAAFGLERARDLLYRAQNNVEESHLKDDLIRSALHLLDGSSRVLRRTRIESNCLSEIDMADFIRSVVTSHQRSLLGDAIKIIAHVDMHSTLVLDKAHLHTIMHNLLANAVLGVEEAIQKNLRGNGLIAVKATEAVHSGSRFLEIAVVDDGIGISLADLTSLGKQPVAHRADGHGTGLCRVQRVAEQYAGYVEISSKPRIGTTVIVGLDLDLIPERRDGQFPRDATKCE